MMIAKSLSSTKKPTRCSQVNALNAIRDRQYCPRSPHVAQSIRGAFVYNSDLIRHLCGEIVSEQDPDKVSELIALLRAIISDDQEEIRTRIAFLAKRYALLNEPAAD
jgi:hypothetical protein